MAYFIRIKGRAFGPYSESQLLEMKSTGKITRASEISQNSKDGWQPAETIDILYNPTKVTAPPSNEPPSWYYSVNGSEGYGPMTATAIEQMIQSGQLDNSSFVWQEGQNARTIKDEPRFSSPKNSPPANNTGNTTMIRGESNSICFGEQTDMGQMLHSIATSLGWLMLLKITCLLVVVIAQGLLLLVSTVFSISHAIGANTALALFITLVTHAIWIGLYVLEFKAFLCFWKYHTDLYKAVATGKASDLIQTNHSQCLFWKQFGIAVIANLAVTILYGITIALIAGLVTGGIAGFFS